MRRSLIVRIGMIGKVKISPAVQRTPELVSLEAHPARLTRHDTHQMGPGLFAPGLFALGLISSGVR